MRNPLLSGLAMLLWMGLLSTIAQAQTEFKQARRSLVGINNDASLIQSQVDNFYSYVYDGLINIRDGGNDMYDFGNRVSFAREGLDVLTEYNRTYLYDDFTFSSLAKHPFTALMWIDAGNTSSKYTIRVRGNAGADGSGFITKSNGTFVEADYTLDYELFELYGSSDASIVEVYFTIRSPLWGSSLAVLDLDVGSEDRNLLDNTASVSNGGSAVENLMFGYTLLSKYPNAAITKAEVRGALTNMSNVIMRSADNPSIILPYLGPTTTSPSFTTPQPTTDFSSPQPSTDFYTVPPSGEFKQARRSLVGIDNDASLIQSQVENFYSYIYDGNEFFISDGRNDMYDNGNMVSFGREGLDVSAEYNRTYLYSDFTFSTFAKHPFTALMWIDSGITSSKYTIQVRGDAGADGSGSLTKSNGTFFEADYTLDYELFELYGSSDPSIVEVYFTIRSPLWGSSLAVLDLDVGSEDRNVLDNTASVSNGGSAVENLMFGYTLLSKYPNAAITKSELRGALTNMSNAIMRSADNPSIILPSLGPETSSPSFSTPQPTTDSNTVPPSGEFREARRSLYGINQTAALIRSQVADFHLYNYDGDSFEIADGGNDMYDGGNNVFFVRGSLNQSAEYNETYLFPDFTFSSLAIHPFVSLMWINSVNTHNKYSIQVNSDLGADGGGSTARTSGTINGPDFVLKYEVIQVFGAPFNDPSVVEVFFVVSKPWWGSSFVNLELEAESSSTHRFLSKASVTNGGSPVENVVFGYTLLSKSPQAFTNDTEIRNVLSKLGQAISNSARNFSINLPPLFGTTTPEPTTNPTEDPTTFATATTTPTSSEEFEQARRSLVGVNRTAALIRSRVEDFYNYTYDGDSFEIYDGGDDMYDGGNNVYFSRGMLNQSAEYNETYTYPDFTFSSLAIHPFTALMWINSANPESEYTIQVISDVGADSSGAHDQLSGVLYGTNFKVQYRVFQIHSAYDPSVVEVFFVISSSSWGSSSAYINLVVGSESRNKVNNKATVTNNGSAVRNVVFGYTLLSKVTEVVTNDTEIRNVLFAMGTAILQSANDLSIYLPPLTNTTTPISESQEARRSLVGINRTSASVRAWVNDFYNYRYDGDSFEIIDGGNDMYDGGNNVYFSRLSLNQSAKYNKTYIFPDFTFSSLAIHPFVSLMWINSVNTHTKYSIQVNSNLGADGSGSIARSSGSVIHSAGFRLKYEAFQVYGARNDPSVVEVFFVVSKPEWGSSSVNIDLEQVSNGTHTLHNRAAVTNNGLAVRNVVFGYTLLSKFPQAFTSETEIRNALIAIGNAISNSAKDFSIILPPLVDFTTPEPTTFPTTHDPFTTNTVTTTGPTTNPFDGSLVGQALQQLHNYGSQILSEVEFVYLYEYDGVFGANYIGDGGDDMYDTGNIVFFNYLGDAEYNETNQYSGFQAGIVASHPFHAVMWVDESYNRQNASITVRSGTGADGRGDISTLSGYITDGYYHMDYRVFQISDAFLDPTICEVYYDVYNYMNWDSTGGSTIYTNFASQTDPTDNTFTVGYSPRRHFIGYMLLSKSPGALRPDEIEGSLRQVLQAYTTVSVPPSGMTTTPTPTFTPPTPTPTGPGPVADVDFLPSCSLRQAIRKVWACESSFTAHAPYNDPGQCRSNVNAVIQCAANQLKNCAKGTGPNIFHRYYLPFDEQYVIHVLRHLASSGSSCHGYDLISNFCNKGSLPHFHPGGPMPFGMNSTSGSSPFAICSHSAVYGIMSNLTEFYYSYVGARTKQEICTAFRTFRDGFVATVRHNCNLGALRYFLDHIHPHLFHYVAQASQVAVDSIAVLEISACPKTAVNNTKNRLGTEWLMNYVKWRSGFLPKWQSSFNRWVETLDGVYHTIPEIPPCLDLTLLRCRDPSQYVCNSDFYTCPFCRCLDDRYIGLSQAMLEPWKTDFYNWQNFLEHWSDAFDSWEMNENL